jgi:hypothetical protein
MNLTMASSSPLVALLIGSSMIHVGAEGSCKSSSMTNFGAKSRKTSALLQMVTSNGSTEEGGRALLSKRAMMSTGSVMSNDYTTENCIKLPYGDEQGKYVHFTKLKGWNNKVCRTYGVDWHSGARWQECVSKCSSNLDKTWKVVSFHSDGRCHCSTSTDTCTKISESGATVYRYSGTSFTTAQWEAWYTEFGFFQKVRNRPYASSCNANNECSDLVLRGENGGINTITLEARRRRCLKPIVSGCQTITAAAEGNTGRRRRFSESSYTDQEL